MALHCTKYDYLLTKENIDLEYHDKYDIERRQMHEKIIDNIILRVLKQDSKNPVLIFMGGCFGLGKSHVVKSLNSNKKINLAEYIYIDPDHIRTFIPEYKTYLHENPWTAGNKTNKEVGYICELMQLHALLNNYNIIVDGSLQNYEWYLTYIPILKQRFSQYKFFMFYVEANWINVLERVWKRSEETGRCIPLKILKDIYAKTKISFGVLKDAKIFDGYTHFENNTIPTVLEENNK